MNEIDHKENHEEIAEHSEGKNIWTGLRYYGSGNYARLIQQQKYKKIFIQTLEIQVL